MNHVLTYIHENIKCHLLVTDLARRFGYSRWHFCEKFRKYTGKTVLEYIRHYRIALAAADILDGKKVGDVAAEYGYDSVGGFCKAFLAEYGCLPREYRKQVDQSRLYYERRKETMYQISDRCAMLREEVMHKRTYYRHIDGQRNVIIVAGIARAKDEGKTGVECLAEGMALSCENIGPYIIPGELIVGFNYGREWYYPEDNEAGWEQIHRSRIPEELAKTYFARRGDYLQGFGKPWPTYTPEELWVEQERAGIGGCTHSNHSVIGYEMVVKYGFEGLYEKVCRYEKQNGSRPLYNAMKRLCLGAGVMGDLYAREAQRLLDEGNPDYNADDLRSIVRTCSVVPRKPAQTLQQAIQAIWFAHIVNTWEDNINANSVGRLDQILYPYYKADIEAGRITKEEAFDLICCLWLKLYCDYDVQQSCVGGTNPDGSGAVNELSYMMLDATEQLDLIRCLSVRFGKSTDHAFVRRAMEVVGHVGKGVPFFFNDDVMIPALVYGGVKYEDACDYTQIGCVETVIPGKSNPHAVTGQTNHLKALEYVLCNGDSMMHPDFHPGPRTGELSELATYDAFYAALKTQIENILDLTCAKIRKFRDAAVENAQRPFKSLLSEGCIESGRDFNDAGCTYDYYQICIGGLPNLADSLAVIRKFVYEEKKYTLAELKTILEENFPDEAVRTEFINHAPKYGNDIDEVDQIAVDLLNHTCDTLEKLSEKYGLSFHAQPFTYLWMIDDGAQCAASPDGRRKGEVIAYSVSPMQGRDFSGLTALFNSLVKFDTKRTPGTTSAIVEVDPKLFTDRNIGTLTDILMESAARGLSNVQFNTVDADTLIEAQKNPERYNNLAVRVSGFSQKFNLLSRPLQDHIIGRTKHSCL